MRGLRPFLAYALGACLCAYPATVAAQHGSEATAAEHAAPAAKHEAAGTSKDSGHAVKGDAKAAEAKPKEPVKSAKADPAAKAEPAKKPASEHEPAAKAEAPAKHEAPAKADAAKHEPAGKAEKSAKPEAEKTASAGHGTKAEPKEKAESKDKAEPKDAKSAKADGPRVTVTRVDETTGAARGTTKPVANSKLEAALGRIGERLEDGRRESVRTSARSANRVRLTWRSTLDWPEELGAAAPEPQMPEPPAAHEAAPDKDHVALVWE